MARPALMTNPNPCYDAVRKSILVDGYAAPSAAMGVLRCTETE